MQIVIDIPNSEIPKRQDIIEIPLHFIDGKVCEAGGYGFDVLPKGHGRLIYADDIALIDEQFYVSSDYYVAESAINDAPTIIEADKESEDKE